MARRTLWFLLLVMLTGCEGRVEESVRELGSDDEATRENAARALGETDEGRPGIEAVPKLTESLKDAAPNVRRLSAYALGRIGPDAKPALPALKGTLDDPEEPVRLAGAYAINAIDPRHGAPLPVLTAAAERGEVRALVALGRMDIRPRGFL